MLSNYPDGLSDNTPGAPWNDPVIPEKEFEITVSQTLSKTTSVWTDNYVPGTCGVDYEPDGEGGYSASGWQDDDDTSDTNWNKIFLENEYSPLQIIQACEKIAAALLSKDTKTFEGIWLPALISSCKDWEEDDFEVMEG